MNFWDTVYMYISASSNNVNQFSGKQLKVGMFGIYLYVKVLCTGYKLPNQSETFYDCSKRYKKDNRADRFNKAINV